MTVIAYPHIQPQGPGPWIEIEQRSATAVFKSPTVGTVRTLDRVGSVWAFTVRYQGLSIANARRLESFLAACRGQGNRFYLPVWTHDQRGSGLGSELFTNGTFANGTSDWTASNAILTAADYAIRLASDGAASTTGFRQAETFSANIPVVLRAITHPGRGTDALSAGPQVSDGTVTSTDYSTTRGLRVASIVTINSPPSANQYPVFIDATSGRIAGDFVECSFTSLARCALVDNGSNQLLQSDEFDTSWTVTAASIDDQATVAPDGTSTADYLVEDGTAATQHHVLQQVSCSSSVQDFSFGVFVKAVNRSWVAVRITETTGSHHVRAWFNVSSGTAGTVDVTGANWTNPRSFIAPAGNGWYYCSVVGRKAGAATAIQATILVGEADADYTFDGLSQNSLAIWRATLARSSVPTRPIQTTTVGTEGSSQTGSSLHLKGLPVSTNGILVAGDWVQIIQPNGSQLCRVTSALNSDAAGKGYLQFEPSLHESPADNAPVISTNPLARCLLDTNSIRSTRLADNCVDIEFTAIEDIVPS